MRLRHPDFIPPSEITPPGLYRERRHFIQGLGVLAAGAALGSTPDARAGAPLTGARASAYGLDEARTRYKEFGTGKGDPAANSGSQRVRPWTVTCDGLVRRPRA